MDRRTFINLCGKGFLAAAVLGLSPRSAQGAPTALECAFDGQNFIQSGEYAKAVISLKQAVRLDPGNDWSYGLLGRAYHGLGQNAEALAAFREAVRLNPADTYSRLMTEIIAQKPVPRLQKEEKAPSPLEKEAGKEEERMLNSLRSEDGLRYQVQRVVIDAGHGGFDPGAVGFAAAFNDLDASQFDPQDCIAYVSSVYGRATNANRLYDVLCDTSTGVAL